VIQLAEQFVPLKLDAEQAGQELAERHGVEGYPTILFINRSGKVVGEIGGYMPPGPFAARMQQIARQHKARPK
jgi:thioredoxin-related protein